MKSLYSRVFLITLLVIAASSLLGFLLSNMYYHIQLKPYNDKKLIGIAEQMKAYIEAEPADMERYLHHAASLGYEMYVTDGSDEGRFYGRSFREKDLDPKSIRLVLDGGIYHGVAQFPNKPFISGFFDNQLSNTVGVRVQGADATYALFLRPDVLLQFGELRTFFAMIGVLTVALSVLFFLISTRYLVKPITRLTEATKRIIRGSYELRLPTRRRDEIGQLAEHFMVMSGELERADQARKQFVSNVSHEIQSPLTSIQGFAHVLAQRELPAEERIHYATIIEAESRHLSMLSKQLMTLSALEQGAERLHRHPILLRRHIRQAIQVLEWQLEEKELLLKLAVPESLTIYGDEVLLTQVWMNLIGNAIHHIPTGSSIEVRAEQQGEHMVIWIEDTGGGIAPEHLPMVFDRFYRADPARDRSSGRTGLGLAIVKKIVQLHGGRIEVSSTVGTGTCFTVELPHL